MFREDSSSVAPLLFKAVRNSNRRHHAFLRLRRKHRGSELRQNYVSARSNCRRWARSRAVQTGSIGRRSTARNANNGSHGTQSLRLSSNRSDCVRGNPQKCNDVQFQSEEPRGENENEMIAYPWIMPAVSTLKGPNLLVEIGVLALRSHRFRGKIRSNFIPHELQLPGTQDSSTTIKNSCQ